MTTYTNQTQRNPETINNTENRNMEMNHNKQFNLREPLNKALKKNKMTVMRAGDHTNQSPDTQQAGGKPEDRTQEVTNSHTEQHNINDIWGHQLQPKQPATI